jgi:hypothetical protein
MDDWWNHFAIVEEVLVGLSIFKTDWGLVSSE